MDKLAPAALAVLCLACSVSAQLDGDNYRLPNNSYPVRYDLELTTYVHEDGSARQFRFDGKVKIELVVKDEGNSSITVHYRKTTITHVKLWSTLTNGTDRVLLDDNSSFVLDPNREFVTVSTPGVILNGTYFLEFEYYGELREDNAGFYRSSYVDDEGKTRWLATTQFSSTDARHAFPCYDEPGIRAPIGLTVIHGSNYSVLSNNLPKEAGQGPIAGYTRTIFEDTPVMQPYLLGVIVSDFVAVSAVQYPRQGVFARYNAIRNGEGDFILEAGYKILKVLESYLETDFALPKIYQVAVPDFAAGAMENYGLVTYKEEKFFYDSRSSPMRQKHEIATVVGHEYGHQFFGNMVSPAWWSYLWMKEGFARYFEYLASDMAFPELRIRETYSIQKMQNAFDLDSLGSSRPMTFYVNTQSEIANVFDNIAYDKGGSMMRMFQHAFGPETFRRALINYLRAKAFQGAYPEDFANAIQQALNNATEVTVPSSITALDILKSWTEKSGYPVITVSRGTDLRVSLIQERYMLKIMDTTEASWIIPYNFATTKNPNFNTTTDTRWLLTNSTILAAEGWSATDWIIFNKQQTGYYRVNYDERLWNLIIEQLMRDPTAIHNMNRAQLVDDVLNFARSGRLGYDTALRLIAYLVRERDYVPWYAANSNLLVLTRLFAGSPKMEYLKRYLLTSINPVFSELGLVTQPSDDLFARQTREIVSMWACAMGSQSCLNKASEILLESVGPSNLQVDPDLRSSIYCAGLVNASEDVFLAVWNRMQTSKDQAFRTDLIYALGCTEKVELKEMFLNTSIANETSGTNYFGQERERVFSSVYRNSRKGTEIALRFFMNNIKKINELYNKGNFGGRAIGSAITGLSKYIVDVELNSLFQDLIEKLSEDNLLRDTDILRALEQSSENLQWIRSKGKDIEDWLELRYPTSTAAPSTTTTTTTTTTEEPTSTTTPERRTTTTLDPPSTTTTTTQSTSTPTAKTTTEEGVTSTTEHSTSSPAYDSTTAEPYVETTTKQDGGGAPALQVTLALLMASVTFSFM
ncbi:aminopeptidase N [Aedes albopictus]|uniref:Aminopeptidase n=1 Tax=Aedes albopictus TaxID=7160 RepID=A0ABM1Y1W3_AEDAL